MDRKSFFNPEHDAWTAEASDCGDEVRAIMRPIFEKWIALGYSPREIAYIATTSTFSLESEIVLKKAMELRQDKFLQRIKALTEL